MPPLPFLGRVWFAARVEIIIEASGDVAERSELLNGTETVTLEGASADGWTLSALVSWSIGLVEYAGEGDITLASGDGALFATATEATAHAAEDGADELRIRYEIDGGEGRFQAAAGVIEATLRLDGATFSGRWRVSAEA